MTREEKKQYLLSNIDALLHTKPFFRGRSSLDDYKERESVSVQETVRAELPSIKKDTVSQDRFMDELDPMCHDVLFDENMPSICMRTSDGHYYEIKFKRTSIALQEQIANSHTIYLCGNPMVLSMRGSNPEQKDKDNYTTIREYWVDRNMDGWRTKAVYTQKTLGNCGLLYYFDYNREIKCRLISYADGYVIISHNDDNGDRLLECIYYTDEEGRERIDCYDDEYKYVISSPTGGESASGDGWVHYEPIRHGFEEIPLVTKRGDVAWNAAQNLIDIFEVIYNIFFVIQKRNGWGIIFIRGQVNDVIKKIAGNVVLMDTSMDGNGDVKTVSPPNPEGMLSSLQDLFEKIQINSSCTFILPKDIKSGGDLSAIAITLTRDLDLKNAQRGVIDWQNFADKMMRLFKYGLAKELVYKKINLTALSDFKRIRISTKFKVWQPFSKTEYNNMLISMKNAGIISTKTSIEKNTEAEADELQRLFEEQKNIKAVDDVNNDNAKTIE